MNLSLSIFILIIGNCCISGYNQSVASRLEERINYAEFKLADAIGTIYKDWQIANYPKFLRSCFMYKSAWDGMKLKIESKLVINAIGKITGSTFKILSVGSALYRSEDQNTSVSVAINTFLKPAFAELNLPLILIENLSETKCLQNEIIKKALLEYLPDMIVIEQSFMCRNVRVLNQFLKLTTNSQSKPVIVMTDSTVGLTSEARCADEKFHTLTIAEKPIVDADTKYLVSSINREITFNAFRFVRSVAQLFNEIPIQMFHHMQHQDYLCIGPYVKARWKKNSNRRFTFVGMKLRAAQISYFWLIVLLDGLLDLTSRLKDRNNDLDLILRDIKTRLRATEGNQFPFPLDSVYYTDFDPAIREEYSLANIVLEGLNSVSEKSGSWKFSSIEEVFSLPLFNQSKNDSSVTLKHFVYGNSMSGALSFPITIDRPSQVYICESTGISTLPDGFNHIWEADFKTFISFDVDEESMQSFKYNYRKAKEAIMLYSKKNVAKCLQVRTRLKDKYLPIGTHVLTLYSTSTLNSMIAWLVIV